MTSQSSTPLPERPNLEQLKKQAKSLLHAARDADSGALERFRLLPAFARKSVAALEATGLKRLVVAGGVGANAALRERLVRDCEKRQARVFFPELALCTDNGAMIALAAAMRWQRGIATPSNDYAFDVLPRWPLTAA